MSDEQTAAGARATKEAASAHQPGQDAFKAILAEDIDWRPFPAFPPSVRLAVVVGRPSEAAPYVVRVKVPRDVKLMPHRHAEDRVYTVLSVPAGAVHSAKNVGKVNGAELGTFVVDKGKPLVTLVQ